MKLIKTLGLFIGLAPLSLALASNPVECIAPNHLYEKANAGEIHDVAPLIKNPRRIETNTWYSVGEDPSTYGTDMEMILDKQNKWIDGGIGSKDSKGMLCSYTNPATGDYVYLQMYFQKPKA